MEVIVWNDLEDSAARIATKLTHDGYTCRTVVANTYSGFSERVDVDFANESEREPFFRQHLLVSDLLLGAGATPIEKAQPFRDLATHLWPRKYPVVVYSTMADDQALMSPRFYRWVMARVVTGNLQDLSDRVAAVWAAWVL